jgi:hypothetical protein
VPFNNGPFQSEREQLLFSDDLGSVEGRIEGRAGVALGEDDSIVEEVLGVVGVEFESLFVEEEHGEYVGDGGRGGGMS